MKKEAKKIKEPSTYTVLGFNCNTKCESLNLDAVYGEELEAYGIKLGDMGRKHEEYKFSGNTSNLCDRCFADISKGGEYWLLYAEEIDHEKKCIKVLDSAVLRKFCKECVPGVRETSNSTPNSGSCLICRAKTGKMKRILEVVVERRKQEGDSATVIANFCMGVMCMKCAKKLSGKKDSLLRIYKKAFAGRISDGGIIIPAVDIAKTSQMDSLPEPSEQAMRQILNGKLLRSVPESEILKEAKKQGINPETTKKILRMLLTNGDIYAPRAGSLRLVSRLNKFYYRCKPILE